MLLELCVSNCFTFKFEDKEKSLDQNGRKFEKVTSEYRTSLDFVPEKSPKQSRRSRKAWENKI